MACVLTFSLSCQPLAPHVTYNFPSCQQTRLRRSKGSQSHSKYFCFFICSVCPSLSSLLFFPLPRSNATPPQQRCSPRHAPRSRSTSHHSSSLPLQAPGASANHSTKARSTALPTLLASEVAQGTSSSARDPYTSASKRPCLHPQGLDSATRLRLQLDRYRDHGPGPNPLGCRIPLSRGFGSLHVARLPVRHHGH